MMMASRGVSRIVVTLCVATSCMFAPQPATSPPGSEPSTSAEEVRAEKEKADGELAMWIGDLSLETRTPQLILSACLDRPNDGRVLCEDRAAMGKQDLDACLDACRRAHEEHPGPRRSTSSPGASEPSPSAITPLPADKRAEIDAGVAEIEASVARESEIDAMVKELGGDTVTDAALYFARVGGEHERSGRGEGQVQLEEALRLCEGAPEPEVCKDSSLRVFKASAGE